MSIHLKTLADILKCSQEQANILLEIIVHGEVDDQYLQQFFNVSKEQMHKIIDPLLKNGTILSYHNDEGRQMLKIANLMIIKEQVTADLEKYRPLQKILFPQLSEAQPIMMMKYEGWEGIRQVYLEVLSEAIRTDENIVAFERIPNHSETKIGSVFLKSYLKRRIENKVLARVITSDTAESREYEKTRNKRYTKVKISPKLKLEGTVNIVGSLVMSYSINPPQGSLLRDSAEAHDLKQIFELAWKAS